MPSYPNFYSTQFALGNATTSADSVTFGFEARRFVLTNYETVDLYVRLTSTEQGVATTRDAYLQSCGGTLALDSVEPLSGLSAYTTSTSAVNKLLRVLALG